MANLLHLVLCDFLLFISSFPLGGARIGRHFLAGGVYEERRKTSACAPQSTQHTLRAKKCVGAVLIVWLCDFSADVRLGGRADEDSG